MNLWKTATEALICDASNLDEDAFVEGKEVLRHASFHVSETFILFLSCVFSQNEV